MMDRLSQFLGQGGNQQQYQDFSQRYQQDPSSISDEEAAQRYREMMRHASPQDLEEAHAQAFSQMSEQERMQMAQQFQQAHQDPNIPWQGYPQDMDHSQVAQPQYLGRMAGQMSQQNPDLMAQIAGPNSPLASTGGKLALAGAAAFLASRYLGQNR
jgi:hypothetical protein